MPAPATPAQFDRAYVSPGHWMWGDIRIPPQLKQLIARASPARMLELGCGMGRYSRYVARQNIQATGVDFSPVAIARARARVVGDNPQFWVSDVTRLGELTGPFDASFDVGCFHCLTAEGQRAYAAEVFRLLSPGGTHLIWALDAAPSDITLSAATMAEAFAPGFTLQEARRNRRRLIASHWYWLRRAG